MRVCNARAIKDDTNRRTATRKAYRAKIKSLLDESRDERLADVWQRVYPFPIDPAYELPDRQGIIEDLADFAVALHPTLDGMRADRLCRLIAKYAACESRQSGLLGEPYWDGVDVSDNPHEDDTDRHRSSGVPPRRLFFLGFDDVRNQSGRDSLGIRGCRRCRLMANERTLGLSELRYRRVFEGAEDGILILNAETGRIEDANPFMTELLGYAHDQFVGRHLWEIGLFKDIEQSKNAFRELQEKGDIRYEDLPLQDENGVRREVEFVSNVYEVGDRKAIQCNIRDITERAS